ncbi:hypothetical protein BH11BAC6_BH11BAC6_07970 [soil metagenome]
MAATYLNIGIEYDNENNFYNALKAYELAMEKESAIINGLCDVAVTLKQLGLQKQALETINQCIKQFEINPRSEKDLRPSLYYSNRANLHRMTGNIELMNQDLELSMKYDLSSPFPYRIKGTLQLENCQNEEAIINYTKSIDCDKTYTAIESRAKLFEILKYYDRAIEDYKTSMERFGRKNSLFYKIRKCYFMNGDIENAQVYYNEFLKTTKKYRNFYEKSYSYGLISSYNITTGIGWILCNTYFNEFDNIFF